MKKPIIIDYNSIPKQIELFGRTIKTIDDSEKLSINKNYGEARYGINELALNTLIDNKKITSEEIKLTYLHEMIHFILIFAGYDSILRENTKIDLEQFIELLAVGFYQYEKSVKYK